MKTEMSDFFDDFRDVYLFDKTTCYFLDIYLFMTFIYFA